jgi:feruloyl esterase
LGHSQVSSSLAGSPRVSVEIALDFSDRSKAFVVSAALGDREVSRLGSQEDIVIRWLAPVFACLATAASAQTPCEKLKALSLPNTTVTAAESRRAGPFKDPARPELPAVILPAHCRIAAVLAPSSDSHIEMELWLPADWNGRFQAVGNGGWAGAMSILQTNNAATSANMASALQDGYATVSTDTGHRAADTPGGSFALGHPDKLIDFAYRAVHEMTITSKAIITAFYGRGPQYSYWNGCSTGGRQGLLEAQRYPADYDGIVAGAPANNWVHLLTQFIWIAQASHKNEASYIPPSKYPLLAEAVLQACDTLDGVKDGIIQDPTRCRFDPKALQCAGTDAADCLTPAQVELARAMYQPSINPRTKEKIYPGVMPGTELRWGSQAGPTVQGISNDYWRYVVFQNPAWDYKTLDFDGHIALAEKMDKDLITATNPDLRAFFARGGKLLHYHGWSDEQISPMNSLDYYNSVVRTIGAKTSDSYRLFFMPGMAHCGGGSGPSQFNAVAAMERWRESGIAPDQMTAYRITDGRVDMTRPLCPYPQVATYTGKGSVRDAANFACRAN